MSILNITNETFEQQVLNAEKPVLVDFWAPWCGYCRRLNPVIDRMAHDESKGYTIVKVNVDDAPALAEKFAINTIPTLILFQKGQGGAPIVAPESKARIDSWLADQGI